VRYRSYPRYNRNTVFLIIGINLLIFIIANIVVKLIDIDAYVRFLGMFGLRPWVFFSQPWTIVTNLFLHGSFWHLFGNMLTLFFFGTYLATLIGTTRFLIVYFGGGILGNILLLLLAPFFPFTVAIGASGAIFTLGGTLAVMRPRLRVFIFPIPVPIPLWAAVIGGFVIIGVLIPAAIPSVIAWQAHLGGLIFGLIAGTLFRRKERASFY